MLPGIGGSEIIVIAVVALLVVGPKDLPKLLRQMGRFVGKMRSMADDFRSSFEDMARQSELDDLRKEVEALRNTRSLPGLEDVKSEVDAIGHDINSSLQSPSFTPVVDSSPESAIDPLMEGLPPRGASETEIPPIVVKKPRARKVAAPAPKPEPEPEVVQAPKRRRSKSTVS